jgi:mannose-6-phosphate isomerase-like protein (cupin superfamily)
MSETTPFPGAIGVSHLRVYDSEAPDGLRGGTPHVHSVCTEAYAVLAGRGAVHTLTAEGFRETPIEAGSFVWFGPGTIHRLVNGDGGLEILVLMSNSALPEAGDMVLALPPALLADPAAYQQAAVLPPDALTTTGPSHAAQVRRDLAVEGFLELKAAVTAGDAEPLERFYRSAVALVGPRATAWRDIIAAGPTKVAQDAAAAVEAVLAGHVEHLLEATVHALPPPPDERRYGCCGTLGTYLPSSSPAGPPRSDH